MSSGGADQVCVSGGDQVGANSIAGCETWSGKSSNSSGSVILRKGGARSIAKFAVVNRPW